MAANLGQGKYYILFVLGYDVCLLKMARNRVLERSNANIICFFHSGRVLGTVSFTVNICLLSTGALKMDKQSKIFPLCRIYVIPRPCKSYKLLAVVGS